MNDTATAAKATGTKQGGNAARKAKLTRLHHITLRVKDFDEGVKRWTNTFGYPPERIVDKEKWGYKMAFFKTANVNIVLLKDYGIKGINDVHMRVMGVSPPESVGFFHMAFATDDIELAGKEMMEAGVNMWDKTPQAEPDWARYSWIDPADTCDTLVHLYQADWG